MKKILLAVNDGTTETSFTFRYKGKMATAILPAGSVATYIWQ